MNFSKLQNKITFIKPLLLIASMMLIFCGAEKKQIDNKESESATLTSTNSSSDTLVITGQLIEAGTMAPNDLYNYVFIVKYKVVSIQKGKYGAREILVGHYNPLIARKQIKDAMDPFVDGDLEEFVVGTIHRLELITPIESVWHDAVEDEYIDSDFPRYYALRADLVRE